ncbi:MAG: galactokinase [Candidatus Hydrogenedentota bacterium]
MSRDKLKSLFRSEFNREPAIAIRSPGRVNLIGEHTDYNGGFVLPMAIERQTILLAGPRTDLMMNVYATHFDERCCVHLDSPLPPALPGWMRYAGGVAHILQKVGFATMGSNVVIAGDLPLASGLSSSASLEMAFLRLFEALGGFTMDGPTASRIGQRVENEVLGLQSGIMDQFAVCMGVQDHALLIDCRMLTCQPIPVAIPNAVFVISDTRVSRGLASSSYNDRVSECSEAVAHLNQALGKSGLQLRDFTMPDLEAAKDTMPDMVYRRARHVLSENSRTVRAAQALREGDANTFGQLMNESDASLRTNYEVTCSELDTMTRIAREQPGCHGSRMTGAGFGGCTVSLVNADCVESFGSALLSSYRRETGREGTIIVSRPANGVALFD